MKLKYIITDYSPVIFNELIQHKDAAIGLERIHSAGFVYVVFDEATKRFDCRPFGESVSLGLTSKSDDKVKLDKMFNNLF